MAFNLKDRVRIKAPKPLPSGRSVQLVALVSYFRPDGLIDVRVCTPGLYSGGIFKVSADEIEAMREPTEEMVQAADMNARRLSDAQIAQVMQSIGGTGDAGRTNSTIIAPTGITNGDWLIGPTGAARLLHRAGDPNAKSPAAAEES